MDTSNKSNSNSKKGILFLVLAAFIYSTMPVLIRTLGSSGIPPVSQVFLRYIPAFLSAAIYFFVIKKQKFILPNKNLLMLLFASVFGYGLTNLFFTIGILNTTVSNAFFLFYNFAIIAPILGYFFLKDKINKSNIIAFILSLIALFILFQPNSIPTWKIGGFFSILAAIAQASYLVARKRLKEYSSSFMMLYNTFLGMLVLGILSLIFDYNYYAQGLVFRFSINTLVATILFGLLNFLAWFTMTKGFEYFKASSGSIILLSELIFGVIFAFLLFQEVPTYMTLIGGVLIIISSVLVILRGEK